MTIFNYTVKWPGAVRLRAAFPRGIIWRGSIFLKDRKMPHARRFFAMIEELRRPGGAFIAAPTPDYDACWVRDQLYCTLSLYFMNETEKFKVGMWVIFDYFHRHRGKIEHAICNPPRDAHEFIHAKFHPDTFDEITHEWGHHQLDAVGLFLYVVGFAEGNGVSLIRHDADRRMLQLIVSYLTAVRYWEHPDFGMWEEELNLHASSIGAVVAGLTLLQEHKLAVVPYSLVLSGQKMLYWLLPNESPDRDVDMALLPLMWPYNVVTPELRELIISRVRSKLVQEHGLNRYWGDNYYRSDNGVSGEWPMGFFWLSIIASEAGDRETALYWFDRGVGTMTPEGFIPELYQNGAPNDHTPLAWAHAMAIIAQEKLRRR